MAAGQFAPCRQRCTVAIVELLSVLALLQFLYFGILVGNARERFSVPAPATAGNEVFERYFRVQMNTLELLVLFLPALWISSRYVGAPWLGLLGALYLIGRFVYLRGYVAEAKKRSLGFTISALPILALLAIALIGSIVRIIRTGWV